MRDITTSSLRVQGEFKSAPVAALPIILTVIFDSNSHSSAKKYFPLRVAVCEPLISLEVNV